MAACRGGPNIESGRAVSARRLLRLHPKEAAMFAESTTRVPEHTAPHVNRSIAERTEETLAWYDAHRDDIPERLRALDREWDVERALATGSSCLSLLGLGLALATRRRGWLALPLAVQGFYLQHTLQGWCPPLPVFRRLGFRTPAEIEEERCALQAMLTES
jgi:hypothetical protein